MNINLTPQLKQMVRAKVASGMYTSASEVVREALRLMNEKDQLHAARLKRLCHDIQEGGESVEAIPWDPAEIKRMARTRRLAKSSSGV
ncbi:MAG: type II toxin-antitoxin system ParD family antitoxin [Pseudomonadota bacterium]